MQPPRPRDLPVAWLAVVWASGIFWSLYAMSILRSDAGSVFSALVVLLQAPAVIVVSGVALAVTWLWLAIDRPNRKRVLCWTALGTLCAGTLLLLLANESLLVLRVIPWMPLLTSTLMVAAVLEHWLARRREQADGAVVVRDV